MPPQGELSARQLDLVVDYFKLCAEEYLFYCEGYIPREVWRSWCGGILGYIRRPPFDRIWQAEVETQTFYGLSLEAIEAGAA